MMTERLVAIPESQLRAYEQMHAAVREQTLRTLERCEDARWQRENPWWRQLREAICSLPEMAQAVIGITVGTMGMLVVFNVVMGAIIR